MVKWLSFNQSNHITSLEGKVTGSIDMYGGDRVMVKDNWTLIAISYIGKLIENV